MIKNNRKTVLVLASCLFFMTTSKSFASNIPKDIDLNKIREKAELEYGREFAESIFPVWDEDTNSYTLTIKKGASREKVTRSQFTTMVMEGYKKYKGDIKIDNMSQFHDTQEPSVYKAYKIGLIKGKDEFTFDPNGKITREEVALILDRYVTALNLKELPANNVVFADGNNISPWAKTSVQRLYTAGVLKGVGGNKINPKGYTTIIEAKDLMKRINKLVEDSKK